MADVGGVASLLVTGVVTPAVVPVVEPVVPVVDPVVPVVDPLVLATMALVVVVEDTPEP